MRLFKEWDLFLVFVLVWEFFLIRFQLSESQVAMADSALHERKPIKMMERENGISGGVMQRG